MWSFRAPIDPSMLTSSQAAEIVPSNWSCWLLSMATCTWGQPSIFWIGAAASLVTAAKNRSASSRHSKQWEQIRRKDKHVFVLGGSQGKRNSGKHFEICSRVWSWRCWMGNMWSYKTTAFHPKSLELAICLICEKLSFCLTIDGKTHSHHHFAQENSSTLVHPVGPNCHFLISQLSKLPITACDRTPRIALVACVFADKIRPHRLGGEGVLIGGQQQH